LLYAKLVIEVKTIKSILIICSTIIL